MAKEKGIGLAALKAAAQPDSKIEEPAVPVEEAPPEPTGHHEEPSIPDLAPDQLRTIIADSLGSPATHTLNVRIPGWLDEALEEHLITLRRQHRAIGDRSNPPTKQAIVTEALVRLLFDRGALENNNIRR
jgi:hypothetical protein